MAISSEKELMDIALKSNFIQAILQSPSFMKTEPKGLFGIPDLIVANLAESEDIIEPIKSYAFEMKLSKWKRALAQAFRYRAFAETVYVVLDSSYVRPALEHLDCFVRANIGLISIDETGTDTIHFIPISDEPYSEHLKQKFVTMVIEEYRAEQIKVLS